MMRAMAIDSRRISRQLTQGGCPAASQDTKPHMVIGVGAAWMKFGTAGRPGHRCNKIEDVVHVRYTGHARSEADELKRYTLILTNLGYTVQAEEDDKRAGRRRLVVAEAGAGR